jgi:hypothetical protein
MPFDWREYLELARFVSGQRGPGFSQEAASRATISRAYYAAYGHALGYARGFLGFAPRRRPEERTQDHGRLRAHLRQRRRHRVADALDLLRDARNLCDYEDDPVNFDFTREAAKAIAAAEYVINTLSPPAPPSAAAGP